DTRFSNDKTPYKTWGGARFFHARSKQVPAPSFYLHIQPGNSFLGGGIWHPEPEVQRRIREFLVDNPAGWQAVKTSAFRRRYTFWGDTLVRPPRGFPADHPLLEDLKRKDFTAGYALDDEVVLGPRLRQAVVSGFKGAAPLVDYLCAALELEF
ncbi:MAG TPA: TIGR02453 family protein, partial [Arenimonas sp.]|nr:TIGR02453 family protein [Arenimonas sp.]